MHLLRPGLVAALLPLLGCAVNAASSGSEAHARASGSASVTVPVTTQEHSEQHQERAMQTCSGDGQCGADLVCCHHGPDGKTAQAGMCVSPEMCEALGASPH
jgi:hypothetical protein